MGAGAIILLGALVTFILGSKATSNVTSGDQISLGEKQLSINGSAIPGCAPRCLGPGIDELRTALGGRGQTPPRLILEPQATWAGLFGLMRNLPEPQDRIVTAIGEHDVTLLIDTKKARALLPDRHLALRVKTQAGGPRALHLKKIDKGEPTITREIPLASIADEVQKECDPPQANCSVMLVAGERFHQSVQDTFDVWEEILDHRHSDQPPQLIVAMTAPQPKPEEPKKPAKPRKEGLVGRTSFGAIQVNGSLPAESVRKIVRQNVGRISKCYQYGLARHPGLEGQVNVRFIINREGAVSNAGNGGSDLPDSGVTSCVIASFYGLLFPKPKRGIVRVTSPILFTPS